MGMFYAYGDALIDEDEIVEKVESGQFAKFRQAAAIAPSSATIDFSTGRMSGHDVRDAMASPTATRTPFQPIGIGRPLTIEIRHVYTGRFPKRTLFQRRADMVVTSAIKGSPVFSEATTAINFVRQDVAAKTGFSTPHADEFGTPVVYYSPSLSQRNSTLTIKFAFDEFPGDEFERVAEVLSGAAGLPLFSPAAVHLHGVSVIARLIGRVGESLFDRHASFRATEAITFARPGSTIPVANFALMMQDDEDERRILQSHVISGGRLIHAETREPYAGDVPYVVISLDGRRNDELNSFMAKSAASLMLGDITSRGGHGSTEMNDLQEAAEIYHDFRLRRRADRIAERMTRPSTAPAMIEQLKVEHDALIANIQTESLRPPATPQIGFDTASNQRFAA